MEDATRFPGSIREKDPEEEGVRLMCIPDTQQSEKPPPEKYEEVYTVPKNALKLLG